MTTDGYWDFLFFFGGIPGSVKDSMAFKLLLIALGKILIASGTISFTLVSFISFSPFAIIFNGIERFLIEKIRVNQSYDFIGFSLTQAEIISFALIITGITFIILTKNKIIFKTE